MSKRPENAIGIDADTGEIFVADASLFNYELNPSIAGIVKISNDESEKEILFNINIRSL